MHCSPIELQPLRALRRPDQCPASPPQPLVRNRICSHLAQLDSPAHQTTGRHLAPAFGTYLRCRIRSGQHSGQCCRQHHRPRVQRPPELAERCITAAIRVRISVRVPRCVSVAVEHTNWVCVSRHRIHGQEHTQLRIHVPLLHVAQPGGRVTHMPGVPRPVLDLPAQLGTYGSNRRRSTTLPVPSVTATGLPSASTCVQVTPVGLRVASSRPPTWMYSEAPFPRRSSCTTFPANEYISRRRCPWASYATAHRP